MPFRFRWHRRNKCPSRTSYGCSCPVEQRIARSSLDNVETGETVKVCCVEGEGRMTRRLLEMGFVPGTVVKVLRRAPLSDPIEYEILGYLVSLRREEASLVRVIPLVLNVEKSEELPLSSAS